MVEIYGYSVATIPVIVALVYGIIEILKVAVLNKHENVKKYIPLFAAVIGAGLGIGAFFAFPAMVPAAEWYYALLMGAASGLSSVGVNQITKQMVASSTKPEEK